MERIFSFISFAYICRDLNLQADGLSKEASKMVDGSMEISEENAGVSLPESI